MSATGVTTIHIDGASRGNPGPAAFAYVIERDGVAAVEHAECIGDATNNVAEYTALVRVLERAAPLGGRLLVHSDSELLVKQMNGEYRVKNEQLLPLYQQARRLCGSFDTVTIRHIRREKNQRADGLCNEVLDGRRGAAAPARKAKPAPRGPVTDAVREEAVLCLRAAAEAWQRGGAGVLTPEAVWEQLWSILEESNLLRKK